MLHSGPLNSSHSVQGGGCSLAPLTETWGTFERQRVVLGPGFWPRAASVIGSISHPLAGVAAGGLAREWGRGSRWLGSWLVLYLVDVFTVADVAATVTNVFYYHTRLDSLIKMLKFSSGLCSVMWAEDKSIVCFPGPWGP